MHEFAQGEQGVARWRKITHAVGLLVVVTLCAQLKIDLASKQAVRILEPKNDCSIAKVKNKAHAKSRTIWFCI